MTSRRDFGSFHASNVQELLNVEEEQYTSPPFPFELPVFAEFQAAKPKFGSEIRNKYFFLEKDCTFINHGAFGATLKPALQVAQKWQNYVEQQPLKFYDRELLPHMVHVSRRLAKFVGCKPTDLVLVPNATTAINSVVRSLNIQDGDQIFLFNTTYGAVKKLLKHVCEQSHAVYQEETIRFPVLSAKDIIDIVDAKLKPGTKLAVFDHITSNQALILPLKEIIEICRQRKVEVLIDGAHALGALSSLPLHPDMGADYYVSNAHKWFCSPKGCAFMYVNKRHHDKIKPLIISHGFGSGFNSQFIWSGLRDYSPFLSLHTVIDFWTQLGIQDMREYMFSMARDAGSLLCKRWDTQLLAPSNMFGTMTMVLLPRKLYDKCHPADYIHAELIQNELYHTYNIEVPIKAIDGDLYVRISAHIYNELLEYEKLATAVNQLMCKEKINIL